MDRDTASGAHLSLEKILRALALTDGSAESVWNAPRMLYSPFFPRANANCYFAIPQHPNHLQVILDILNQYAIMALLIRHNSFVPCEKMLVRRAVLLTHSRNGNRPLWSYRYTGTLPQLISFVSHSYENTRGVGVFFPIWNSPPLVITTLPALSFHSLTGVKFHNSFVFKFMNGMGGVSLPGLPLTQTPSKVLGFKVDWGYGGFIASVSRDRYHIFLSEGDRGHPGSWFGSAWATRTANGAI